MSGPALEDLFALCERASRWPDAERRARLLAATGDPTIVDEVLSLLEHDPGAGTAHDRDAAHDGDDVDDPAIEGDGSWSIVGLRLFERLGRGGHCVVLRAEQAAPRRDVAVKLLPVAASARSRRRLHAEGEALARLRHPGIARVLRTGTACLERDGTPVGPPRAFMVMEHVVGRPLDGWIAECTPSLDVRMRVLEDVARAVHHAHQRGVLHRDLKPANIVVEASDDGRPVPRVLDFGIARLLDDPDAPASTRLTLDGQVLGTPGYMSPEQIEGDVDAVDTRTDVFALGRVAWACLAGREPFDAPTGPLLRRLCEARDARPDPLGRVDRRLAGDLELVVETAMDPDPARRHASAAAFADDLERVRERRPVLARRPTAAYVLRRFVSRQPWLVALGGAACVGLVGAMAALGWGLDQANERIVAAEEGRAVLAERDAATLSAMVEIAGALEPIAGTERVRRTALEDIVARYEARIERGEGDRATRLDVAEALETLASVDEQVGDLPSMLERSRQALALRRELVATASDDGVEERRALARSIVRLGDAHQAHRRARRGPAPGHEAEIVARYGEAHALLDALAAAHPEHVGVLDDLQWSCDRMAFLHRDVLPDPERERRHFERRRTVIERVLALDPAHPHARRGLVKHLAQRAAREPDAAIDLLAEALGHAQALQRERPADRHAVSQVRWLHTLLVKPLARAGRASDATRHWRTAVDMVFEQREREPGVRLHVSHLAGLLRSGVGLAAAAPDDVAIHRDLHDGTHRLADAVVDHLSIPSAELDATSETLVLGLARAAAADAGLAEASAFALDAIVADDRMAATPPAARFDDRVRTLAALHRLGRVDRARVESMIDAAPADIAWSAAARRDVRRALGPGALDRPRPSAADAR